MPESIINYSVFHASFIIHPPPPPPPHHHHHHHHHHDCDAIPLFHQTAPPFLANSNSKGPIRIARTGARWRNGTIDASHSTLAAKAILPNIDPTWDTPRKNEEFPDRYMVPSFWVKEIVYSHNCSHIYTVDLGNSETRSRAVQLLPSDYYLVANAKKQEQLAKKKVQEIWNQGRT